MLYTASFYSPEDWVGLPFRVSRQHPRGRRTQWDVLPFFYPERHLLQSYRAGDLDFPELARQYLEFLEVGLSQNAELRAWLEGAKELGDFTLLCFEAAGEPCHRRVLAEWLSEKVPGLLTGQLR